MEVIRMLGHTGVVLKINGEEHKIFINETWFSFDPKLTVSPSLIGQSVQYSLGAKNRVNHLELMVQPMKELKGKIQSLNLTNNRIKLKKKCKNLNLFNTYKNF